MNEASVGYWETLSSRFGAAWNRFRFTPGSVVPVAGMRWLVGLASLYFVASHTADLTVWFGTRGLLPVDTVTRLTGEVTESGAASSNLHWSYLNYFTRPVELWVAHTSALGVVALFTLGLWSRVTGILSLVVVLSYIHRAPMLTGQFEPIFSMLLAYLCLAPTGAWASVDRWLRRRKAGGDSAAEPPRTVVAKHSSQPRKAWANRMAIFCAFIFHPHLDRKQAGQLITWVVIIKIKARRQFGRWAYESEIVSDAHR